MTMKKSTRVLIGIVGTFVFLLFLAVIVVKIVFTKERILAILTPQLERLIDRPVSIADAGITLWGGIGVRLEGVTVGNAAGFSNEPMFSVGKLDIKAQFWPLLSGKAVIDRIVIEEPYLLIEYDAAGRSNLDGLVKEGAPTDTAGTDGRKQELTIGMLAVREARLAYRDKRSGRWIDLYGADIDAEVDVRTPNQPSFAAELRFDSLMVLQAERRIAVRQGEPSVFVDGSWNKSTRTLTIDSSVVEWWGAKLATSGQVRFLPSLYEIGINARLGSVKVEELIQDVESVFPLPKLAELKAIMSGTLQAQFAWPLPENSVPDWQGRFELVDLRWPLPQTGAEVTLPRVEIRGSDRSISWSAPGGQITGGSFSTSGTIDQLFLGDKTFSARVQANMPLEGMRGLLPEEWRSSVAGMLDLDITGFGAVDQWRTMHINGQVATDRFVFANDEWDFDSVAAAIDMRLTGHGAQLSRCDWVAGDSRGSVTGRIENIIPAALSDFARPDIPHGEFEVVCAFLNLDRLLGDETIQAESGDSAAIAATGSDIPLLSITGNLTTDTLIYNGLRISNARSPFVYRDRVFSLTQADGQLYGGTISGRLDWNLNSWPHPEFFTSVTADGIEANDFFSRYLGWAGGILGQLSVSGEFSGRGRTATQILPTLLAQGRVDLSSTRLESAPLLAIVGRSVGLSGLDRPRNLSDLRFPFRIENGRIVTDEIRLTWDDVNYTIRGSYGLDQSLAYSVSAKSNSAAAPRIVQGVGLKFNVSGPLASPSVSVDAAGTARDVIDNVFDQAKDTLQKTLDQKLKDFFQPRKP